MADFYAHQAAARRQTRYLVLAFVLTLVSVVVVLDLVVFTLFGGRDANGESLGPIAAAQQHPGAVLGVSLVLLAVMALASVYKSLELRGGGSVVALSLGGVRVDRNTTDLKRKRLVNVIEEMAIASGVPVPEIYVLEQEAAINAFAAGHTPANAAVTVTQGALDRLNREELQGVIGHEFSHVLNGDMRLNVQLMGWLFGLLVVALIGRMILRIAPRGRDRRNAGGFLILALAMIVLGYIGLLAGRILQAAVSRQRERLADASSVQFTRNPQGLKGALLKIAALEEGSYLQTHNAEQVAHMLFAPGLSRMFATHPPLIERIRELDPHFDARELERIASQPLPDVSETSEQAATEAAAEAQRTGIAAQPAGAALAATAALTSGAQAPLPFAGAPSGPTVPAAPQAIATQVGKVGAIHIEHAQSIRLRLPDFLGDFAASPDRARSLVVALLLSRDYNVRAAQMQRLAAELPPPELAAIETAAAAARELEPMLQLPALLQIFPALRRSTRAERLGLARLASELIHADTRIDMFEFCLAKLLEMLLRDELDARAPHGSLTLEDAAQPIHVLFATLARTGANDEQQARRAYEAGMQSVLPMRRPPFVSYPDWPKRLAMALPVLEQLQPFAKQALIEGMVRTIGDDGELTVEEAELLRTTCALLHCPLPPLLAG